MASSFNFFPKKKSVVYFDGDCNLCNWLMRVIKTLDIYHQLKLINLRDPKIYRENPKLKKANLEEEMHLKTQSGDFKKGFFAFRYLTTSVPTLFPLAVIFYFPTSTFFGPKIYSLISKNRYRLFGSKSCAV